MKIHAQEPLKTLSGENYQNELQQPVTVGSVIADVLAADQARGKMKMFVLAKKFYEEKEVELDAADVTLVKSAIESSKAYNNIILGTILLTLEGSKD